MEIFSAIAISVVSTLIVSGLTALVVYFGKQAKTYKALLEGQQKENLRNTIREEIEPVIEEIHRLQTRIENCEKQEKSDIGIILNSYKFRLIQLCQTYLRQGFLTQTQFDQISEFHRVYVGLGGNGQAQEYYDKVKLLPIRTNNEQNSNPSK